MIRAFGAPSLYVQGPGALSGLGHHLQRQGIRRPLVIIDQTVAHLLGDRVRTGLGELAASSRFAAFQGECTAAEIKRLASAHEAAGADGVIGIGGGKAIDTAKGVRIQRACRLLVIPTVASNDSPTSRLAVIYKPDHSLAEVRRMPSNPDLVLVDTEILIGAPERFFIAGIGDALSKKFEVAQSVASGQDNFYQARPTQLATAMADICYATIRAHALDALAAIRTGQCNEAFEQTVEATILLSGLAFENGGLSIAHSLTRGLSALPATAQSLHGEQVAFGLLVQLVVEQRSEPFLQDLIRFYRQVKLPRSLEALGLRGDTDEAARQIAQITWERAPYASAIRAPIDVGKLETAILHANHMGLTM